jgi:hypothetical protein
MVEARRYEMAAEDKSTPTGNQQKFAWIYDLGADKELSAPAKTVATLTALKLAGHKGYFKATHKAIANLCGMTYRTVRRAVDELAYQNYWDIQTLAGGANICTIIPPAERIELWLDEEDDYRQRYRRWLDAKKQFVQKWLDAENQCVTEWLLAEWDACDEYQRKVFDAVMDRCENSDYAWKVAKGAWATHQVGKLPLADALAAVAAKPQETFPKPDPALDQSAEMDNPLSTDGQPPVHQWTTPCPQVDNPLSNSDSLTIANDQSHKSFKSVKTYKDSLKPPPAPRAGRALCGLGYAAIHGLPVLLWRGSLHRRLRPPGGTAQR